LIDAQRGVGNRSSFYSDYAFGVRSDDELVPIATVDSGCTDEESRRFDRLVRDKMIAPVREVTRGLVLEIGIISVRRSPSSFQRTRLDVEAAVARAETGNHFARMMRQKEKAGTKENTDCRDDDKPKGE
jgi:ATP-dependent DNA ligase